MDQTTYDVISVLYASLALAAGGEDVLQRSNELLRDCIRHGDITDPDVCKTLLSIIEAASEDTTVN